jgi:hypothetical protein
VGSEAGLETVDKKRIPCICRESNYGSPICSLSLYRLFIVYYVSIRIIRRQSFLVEIRSLFLSLILFLHSILPVMVVFRSPLLAPLSGVMIRLMASLFTCKFLVTSFTMTVVVLHQL